LLRAGEDGAVEGALAIFTGASAAGRTVGDSFVSAYSIRVAHVIRAIFAVIAVGIGLTALLTLSCNTGAQSTVARRPVLKPIEAAHPVSRVAKICRTLIIVGANDRGKLAGTGRRNADVSGAQVVVFAHDANAKIANTIRADALTTIDFTGRSVGHCVMQAHRSTRQ
jgi:hypothetical protein